MFCFLALPYLSSSSNPRKPPPPPARLFDIVFVFFYIAGTLCHHSTEACVCDTCSVRPMLTSRVCVSCDASNHRGGETTERRRWIYVYVYPHTARAGGVKVKMWQSYRLSFQGNFCST